MDFYFAVTNGYVMLEISKDDSKLLLETTNSRTWSPCAVFTGLDDRCYAKLKTWVKQHDSILDGLDKVIFPDIDTMTYFKLEFG